MSTDVGKKTLNLDIVWKSLSQNSNEQKTDS